MLLFAGLFAAACSERVVATADAAEAGSPYPKSTRITGIAFEWHTHKRLALGSDNWPITWSANDQQYTAWGDGSGFGAPGTAGRVSLGVARVEGTSAVYRGFNVWGGTNAEVRAAFEGKSYGIIAIGTDLYMWRCGTGGADLLGAQRLHKSTDNGRSWTAASWEFPPATSFYCPAPLQFGKGYAGARDAYVYIYAAEQTSEQWGIHKPGKITLMRVPQDALMNRASYEFFTGRDASGNALWSPDINARRPVIEDRNGLRLVSAIYNPGLDRYLIGYAHTERRGSDMAILDGPTPWGPWTTVMYDFNWGAGQFTGSCCLLIHFAPKWWLNGGRRFTAVFSGGGAANSWNTVEGTFTVNGTAPPPLSPQRPAQSTGSAGSSRDDAAETSSPDRAEETSTPGDAAEPASRARRQIYMSDASPTSTRLSSRMNREPARQRSGTVVPAKGEAVVPPAAKGAVSSSGPTPAPSPAPAEDTSQAAEAGEDAPAGAADPGIVSAGEPTVDGTGSNGNGSGTSTAIPPEQPTRARAAGQGRASAAPVSRSAVPAATDVRAAAPPLSALREVPLASGPEPDEAAPMRGTTASRQPASAAPVLESMPEASPSFDPQAEIRLVGTMMRGVDLLAIVVPAGASEAITVRPGDMLGPWSVENIEGHTLALRAGNQTLDLRLFREAADQGRADPAR